MGLSSKQVSSDGQDWNESFLQAAGGDQAQPLKCPRCDSTNTKFCYYNNYNKSQPRYLCKSCKRHWTKGGTLRNVPVGGGRKKKKKHQQQQRLRTTSNNNLSSKSFNHPLQLVSCINAPSSSTKPMNHAALHQMIKEHRDGFSLAVFDSKQGSSFFNDNNNINTMPNFDTSKTTTPPLSSLLINPLDHPINIDLHHFPYSLNLNTTTSCFLDNNNNNNTPCMSNSNNFQLYNHDDDQAPNTTTMSALEETVAMAAAAGLHDTISTISSGSPRHDQLPWTTTTTTNMHTSCTSATTFSTSSSSMPTTNWGWDDIDKFASVDITIPWDDDDIDINIP